MDSTAAAARPGISIEALSVGYAGQAVIEGLSLAIERGSFFTLLGPSGCGKTTLLRSIAGFVPARAGRIRFGERDVTAVPPHQRDIGMVFQDYALFPDKTVFDNVAYGLRARRRDSATIGRQVGEALERVGLAAFAQRQPAALSGGQRQRVALARALVIEPQVLLMDEPLSNLDAKLRVQVRQTIAELQADSGITTVFVTHDQDEALALSHRIGVMHQGRLEQVGTPAQIYREPASGYVADFVGAANLLPVTLDAPAAAGAALTVSLAGAAVRARAVAAVAAGPALLMARPETLRLGAAAEGALRARVLHRQYLGEKTSYRVALDDGQTLQLDCHGPGHDAHALGSTGALSFDPAATMVLAR
ncbi:MAG: ABC transporter ATP-binding protein [Burkholderiaceae bacterium]